jgi:hypothetical protein
MPFALTPPTGFFYHSSGMSTEFVCTACDAACAGCSGPGSESCKAVCVCVCVCLCVSVFCLSICSFAHTHTRARAPHTVLLVRKRLQDGRQGLR